MRKILSTLGAAALGLAILAPTAEAQVVPPQPLPVTDYANYPSNNGLPPGCDANGIFGVSFTLNGGAPVANLRDLTTLNAGDVVSMSWTGISDACAQPVAGGPAPVALAMKSARDPFFDPADPQRLEVPYGLGFLTPTGTFSYTLPPLNDDSYEGCNGQLDAVAGLPLEIVGPGGSYYNGFYAGGDWDMLIGEAWNGSYEQCEPFVTTTTTTPTTTTEAPTTTVPETTTTAPATTTTAPPAPPAPPAPQNVTPPADTAVMSAGDSATQVARPRITLAETGLSARDALALAVALAAVGTGVLLLGASLNKRKETDGAR